MSQPRSKIWLITVTAAFLAGCETEDNADRGRTAFQALEAARSEAAARADSVVALPGIEQARHWLNVSLKVAHFETRTITGVTGALDLPPYWIERPDSFELKSRASGIRDSAMRGIDSVRRTLDKARTALDNSPGKHTPVRSLIEQARTSLYDSHAEYGQALEFVEQAHTALVAGNPAVAIRGRPEAAVRAEAGRPAYGRALNLIEQSHHRLDKQEQGAP